MADDYSYLPEMKGSRLDHSIKNTKEVPGLPYEKGGPSSERENKDAPNAYEKIHKELTERRIAQKEILNQVENMKDTLELKNLFTDILCHDILNPLQIIGMYSGLLSDSTDLPEEEAEMVKLIETNNEKAVKLVKDAMAYTKIESMEGLVMETTNLKDILEMSMNAIEPFFRSKDMALVFTCDGSPYVRCNPSIKDVFENLLSNAAKFSPKSSVVELVVEETPDHIRVSVKDRGMGVHEKDKEKIFERFERGGKTGIRGFGIGLAITKRIVEMHNGKIWVEDNSPGGSIFVVEMLRY
jgi:signal transduction histidine kinase